MANGYGYGSAYGWQAAGRGLRHIGQLLGERKRREELLRTLGAEQERERLGERTQELAQPGATTLGAYLSDPGQYDPSEPTAAGGPITEESLRRIGDASQTDVPIEFRAPPPETIEGVAVRDRPAYLTRAGVVMDPRAARREGMMAQDLTNARQLRHLGRAAAQEAGLREAMRPSMEEREEEAFRLARATARGAGSYPPRERTPGERTMNFDTALKTIPQLYGWPWDAQAGTYRIPPGVDAAWMHRAARAIIEGLPPIDLPGGPQVEAPPPTPTAPAAAPKGPGLITRLGRGLVPGGRGFDDPAPRGTPRGVSAAEVHEAARTGSVGISQQEYDLAIQELVNEGWSPEEAQGYVQRRYTVR